MDNELKLVPESWRRVLLTDNTSKCNKVWIAVGLQSRGYWLEWFWEPESLKGFAAPVRFRFDPKGKLVDSKSYDETYQSSFNEPKKKK